MVTMSRADFMALMEGVKQELMAGVKEAMEDQLRQHRLYMLDQISRKIGLINSQRAPQPMITASESVPEKHPINTADEQQVVFYCCSTFCE